MTSDISIKLEFVYEDAEKSFEVLTKVFNGEAVVAANNDNAIANAFAEYMK